MDVSSLISTSQSGKGAAAGSASKAAQENQDRFLTLLVAQMKNQDPMNPMENAQLTTQIAQIQTVTGIDQLKTTIEKFGAQDQLSGAVGMVGHTVTMTGNRMLNGQQAAQGQFELSGAADSVKVEVLNSAGVVLEAVDLGAASAGKHSFTWQNAAYNPDQALQFRVSAKRGATPVAVTTFSRDQVVAINNKGGAVQLDLASGQSTDFASILSVD